MKKLLYRPGVATAILIAVYFFGLAINIFAVGGYSVYFQQRKFLFRLMEKLAADYVEDIESVAEHTFGSEQRLFVYDADGSFLFQVVADNTFRMTDIGGRLPRYLPAILDGKDVYTQTIAAGWDDILIIAGHPVRDGDTVVGALIIVKVLKNILEAVISCCVSFTVLYWMFTVLCIRLIRKSTQLESVKQSYIANITHELKSPITSTKIVAEALSDHPDMPQEKRMNYYGVILREMNLQSHMVQEILDVSRLQSGEKTFSRSVVNAAKVFAPTLQKYAMLYDCAGIKFSVSDALDGLPELYTDPSCIVRVLEILLENAVKYVPCGGSIRLDVYPERQRAVFCVRDTGVGIKQEHLPHVFERFYRCNPCESGGNGLGLSIAQELQKGLRESIWVKSEVGKGAAFYFTARRKRRPLISSIELFRECR